MSGDLLELLFIAAFILFGLLGGRKKKRPSAPAPRPRPRPDTRSAADRTPSRRPVPATWSGGAEQERLLGELEGLLTGRPARTEPEPTPEPVGTGDLRDPEEAWSLESLEPEEPSSWEESKARTADVTDVWRAGRARAAETLETLEGAGGKSHERFHALYDRPSEAARPARGQPLFPTADIRRAVIWSEILGPPVSMRQDT